jgi:hypothetical protein
MHRTVRNWLASLTLPFALGLPQAQAYTHPCIPATLEELGTIKTNLDKEPWKTGYAILAADSKSQLDYTMQGPFASTSRNPYLNLNEWRNDMVAVYNLARMWHFTGNGAYAQKARDILIAWANTHTSFGGWEAALDLGDYAVCYGGGASILRGTWPGWTAADTTTVQNYFLNTLWPATLVGGDVIGPANKGSLYMAGGIAIAVFCDDTAKFDHILNHYRTAQSAGLQNTLATGQMGETGRDLGHGYVDLLSLAFTAEVAWKQGIDLYSELDNRLLACGEYYARNNLMTGTPFVPFGTIDYNYYVPSGDTGNGWTGSRAGFYLLQNAYKNRKNLPTPWIDRKLAQQHVDGGNFMYAKTVDFTTAAPPTAVAFPAVSLASSGLTLTTLGSQTAGRSASHANGVWTVTGLGNNVWSDTADDCQFVYKEMTGDCAMLARVTSTQYPHGQAKAGLMIRDNLTATVSQRAWVGIVPATTNLLEAHMRGWTENWGGTGRDDRSHGLPPGMPYWLKIERRGNLVTTFSSQDGTSWGPVLSSNYGNLPSILYIGLFVSSGNTTTNTATFDNVAFTGGTGGLVTTPAAPAAVLTTGSSKAISVRWLPSFGATSYDLLRSTTTGSGYTVIVGNLPATKTSYTDTTAVAGTTYYYVARARNSAGTSGNSPEFSAALLAPAMANLAFSGTATASFNQESNLEGAYKAFDSNPGSKWFGWNAATGWLQYDFGAGNEQVVKRYTINSADVAARDPKDWNFLGSQDGSSWTTLDSQSNQSFAIRMQQNTYPIGNTTAYRYYRLDITANNGSTGVAIAELGMWSDSGRTTPDGVFSLASRHSNKVMTALSGGTANGTQLVQWGYTGGDEQKWTLSHLGNGQYKVTGLASGRVMDVGGGSGANAAKIQLWDWLDANSQKWTVVPTGDGYFRMTAVHSGKVADVEGPSTADGAKVHQWSYVGAQNQQWTLTPFSTTAITRLQSHNFPTRHLRHSGYRGRIDENVFPVGDSQFRVRIGMTNASGVSFESVNFAGYFLRVRTNGEVWVDKNENTAAFRDSATFERVPGLADSSKSSFRMWTDSTRYLRHSGYWLYAQSGSGSAFNGDATFAEIQP